MFERLPVLTGLPFGLLKENRFDLQTKESSVNCLGFIAWENNVPIEVVSEDSHHAVGDNYMSVFDVDS